MKLHLILIGIISACHGAPLPTTSQAINQATLSKQTLDQQVPPICASLRDSERMQLTSLCQRSARLHLTAPGRKWTIDVAYAGLKNNKEQYRFSGHNWLPGSLAHAVQSFTSGMKSLKTIAQNQRESGVDKPAKTQFIPVEKTRYSVNTGQLTSAFRIYSPRERNGRFDIDSEIRLKGRKSAEAFVINLDIIPAIVEKSMLLDGQGSAVAFPYKNGVYVAFEMNVEIPHLGIPIFTLLQLQTSANSIMNKLRTLFLGEREQDWPRLSAPEGPAVIFQKIEYRGALYALDGNQKVCDLTGFATIDRYMRLGITIDDAVCLGGLVIAANEIFGTQPGPYDANVGVSYDPEQWQGAGLLTRSPTAGSVTDPISGEKSLRIYNPPKINFIHPLIQDSKKFIDAYVEDNTSLYDPTLGRSDGVLGFEVHDVDIPYYNRYLDANFNVIRFSRTASGFAGISREALLLFDRMEFFFSYRPILVPKLILYGDMSHLLSANPGPVIGGLLKNVRIVIEATKVYDLNAKQFRAGNPVIDETRLSADGRWRLGHPTTKVQ